MAPGAEIAQPAVSPPPHRSIRRLASGADGVAGIEAERAGFARVFASPDAREGTAAFVGKRPPRFGGSWAPGRVR